MKQLLAFCTFSLLSLSSYAHQLTVKIEGIESTDGYLYIALHNSDKTWMTDQPPVQGQKLPMTEKTMQVVFKDLPEGDYGVTLYQDENDNGHIDKNGIGIPTEPYGFSQNGGSFGPPSFDSAKVKVAGDTETTIYLQ